MTDSTKAITAVVVAIITAVLGVVVAAGLPLSKDLQDHVIALITVLTPAVIGGIAWIHHNHTKVAAARLHAEATVNAAHHPGTHARAR
jgi:hypothetical protein